MAPNIKNPANAIQSARGVLATLSMPSHNLSGIDSAESMGVVPKREMLSWSLEEFVPQFHRAALFNESKTGL